MRDAGRFASVVGVDGYDFFAYFTPGLMISVSLVAVALLHPEALRDLPFLGLPDDTWLKGAAVSVGLVGFFMVSYAFGHLTASIGNWFDDRFGESTKTMLFGEDRRRKTGCSLWMKARPYNEDFIRRLHRIYRDRFDMPLRTSLSEQGLHIWMMHNYNQAYCRNRDWYHRFIYKMVVLYGFCSNMGTSLLIASLIMWMAIPSTVWWVHMLPVTCAAIWYLLFHRTRHLYYNYYVSTIVTTFVTSCEEPAPAPARSGVSRFRGRGALAGMR